MEDKIIRKDLSVRKFINRINKVIIVNKKCFYYF